MTTTRRSRLLWVTAAAAAMGALAVPVTVPAVAQQARPPALPQAPDPKTDVPEKMDSTPLSPADDTTGTLSDRLRNSRGVITPPGNVDPDIRVPAPVPNPGTTPVIPPPGTPGGADAPTPR